MSPSQEKAFLSLIKWMITITALGLFTSLSVIAIAVVALIDRLGGLP